MKLAVRLLIVITFFALPAAAQYRNFIGGQNKVRYDTFDWKIYETAHFRISYYDRVEPNLEKIASFSESAYDELARRLNFQIFEPVQMITYATHSEFEQTNVIVSFIPEGVGAFATPVRNRMVLPVDLPDHDLQLLILHELTHIFQYEILFQGRKGRAIYRRPPQWFMEGMASYFADDEDSKAEAYMRDAVLSDRLPSVAQPVGGYFAYRFGNKVFQFIEAEWGEDGVRDFVFAFRNIIGNNVERPLMRVFGMDVFEFDGAFRAWLRAKYSGYADRQTQREFGRRFLAEKRYRSQETSPVASPSGDLVAAFTTYREDVDVAIFGVPDRNLYRNLTKGYTTKYDYLVAQGLTVGSDRGGDLSFSPDGNLVAVAARTQRTRAILLLDTRKKGIAERYEIPLPIDQVAQPAFSHDSRRVAFKGIDDGQADIYELNRDDGSIRQITDDDAYDSAPAYAPDGKSIVFSSQTAEHAKLMQLQLDGSGERRQITFGPGHDEAPVVSLDGKRIYFASDREQEVFDIYSYDIEADKLFRLTRVVGAALNPAPVMTLEGERVVFQAFSRGAWNLYVADPNQGVEVEPSDPDELEPVMEPYVPAVSISVDPEKAEPLGRRKLYIEDAFLNVGVDQTGNFLSQTYITFADNYGDRRLAVIFDSISTYSNIRLNWINLEPRLQWGVTIFDDRSYYLTGYDPLRESFYDREQTYRQSGATVFGQYPLSSRYRAEASLGYVNRAIDYIVMTPAGPQVQPYTDNLPFTSAGFAGDTVLWKRHGPHQGSRWEFRLNYGYDLEDGGALAKGGQLEWRKYLALSRRSEIALRVFLGYSDGSRPSIYSFGGLNTIRGFPTYSISGNRGGFANLEWRFPLIDRMDLSFMSIGDIRARFFLDVGAAWYDGPRGEYNYLGEPGFVFIGEKEVDGEIVGESGRLRDGVSTYGFGISMNIMGIPIHWDWVQRWDFKDSMGGLETQFWIGYRF